MVTGPASFSLEGRHALVTGGASGIGAAIAEAFAASGADVAVTMHERGADATLAAIRARGRKAEALAADLSQITEDAAGRLVAEAEARLGPLDILVNNAGIIRRADALDHRFDDWREVMAVNLDAVWLLSQAAARRMAMRSTVASSTSPRSSLFRAASACPAMPRQNTPSRGLRKRLPMSRRRAGSM